MAVVGCISYITIILARRKRGSNHCLAALQGVKVGLVGGLPAEKSVRVASATWICPATFLGYVSSVSFLTCFLCPVSFLTRRYRININQTAHRLDDINPFHTCGLLTRCKFSNLMFMRWILLLEQVCSVRRGIELAVVALALK